MDQTNPEASNDVQAMGRLVHIMRRLLAPDGCPWDREQTFASLRQYVIEEAYEVAEAIDRGDRGELREELGDLLLQIVFQSELAAGEGAFVLRDVIDGISDKLVRRHPHVFGETRDATTSSEVLERWEEIKQAEKARSALQRVPRALPALTRAVKYLALVEKQQAAARETRGARLKALSDALEAGAPPAGASEAQSLIAGAVLEIAALCRELGVDPEQLLAREIDTRLREL